MEQRNVCDMCVLRFRVATRGGIFYIYTRYTEGVSAAVGRYVLSDVKGGEKRMSWVGLIHM